jgi:branched-subunit amino acid aminotransferase/4-amino-4-deoxychorismate lyase
MRTRPRTKGPDLDWLAGQRAAAVAAGADEAVLLSRSGRVLEGATTSIMWWHGDKLCAPPPDAGVLPGITRLILLDLAAFIGVGITLRCPVPAELAGLEVWAVNALHGIRPVTGWVGADIEPGPVRRAARWQCYLDEFVLPVRSDCGKEPALVDSAVPAPEA